MDGGLIIKSYSASILRCHMLTSPRVVELRRNMAEPLASSYWDDFDWLAEETRKGIGHSESALLEDH